MPPNGQGNAENLPDTATVTAIDDVTVLLWRNGKTWGRGVACVCVCVLVSVCACVCTHVLAGFGVASELKEKKASH